MNTFITLATFFWDPPREAFTIPLIDFAIYWYSLFYACGFFVAYCLVVSEAKRFIALKNPSLGAEQVKETAYTFADRLVWYVFVGMLVGARLGHVFFYEWDYFQHHLFDIFMIRKGGLASHGGAFGVLLALLIFWHYHGKDIASLTWLKLLDWITCAAAFAGGSIRIGNFFNQEIIGKPTQVPWAVVFGHPAEPTAIGPCHPAQLYEAFFYFSLFALLFVLLRKTALRDGRLSGLFFTLTFTFRFLIEWLKIPQEASQIGFLNMGQLLSIPFIALGLFLFFSKPKKTS